MATTVVPARDWHISIDSFRGARAYTRGYVHVRWWGEVWGCTRDSGKVVVSVNVMEGLVFYIK